MSLEVMRRVLDAEEAARRAKQKAEEAAEKAVLEAEKNGQASVEAAITRGEDEINHLQRASDVKAAENAMELKSTTSNRQAAMQARAENRLNQAAKLIVERIVKGG
jgi:V/A-type H+/Na+-transporting ATPase subunit G/H